MNVYHDALLQLLFQLLQKCKEIGEDCLENFQMLLRLGFYCTVLYGTTVS